MKEIFTILVSAILVDNFVLSKFLGCCPFLGVSKKMDSALGMSGAVIFVMGLASAATWPIQTYLLTPLKLDYMGTIVFILIIAALVQLVETIMKKYLPALHRALGIYLPLITTNCAVLGVTLLNIESQYTFIQAVVNGIGAGIGIGFATGKASEAIARQPEAAGKINSALLLGCALAEGTAIFGFITALLVIFMG